MKVVCCVAEKPSVCTSIAQALAGSVQMNLVASQPVPVYEFGPCEFQGERVMYRVTSVLGHMMSLDFTEAYDDWDSCAPRELLEEAPVRNVPTNGKVVKTIRDAARGVSEVILFLDCDREGEAICVEVRQVAKLVVKKDARFWRAKFSAVTPADVQRAMQNLGSVDDNQADAVLTRQELDLRLGVAITRWLTLHFRDKYYGLDATTLSFGPAQTPTLGFVCERQDAIASFEPETYWKIEGHLVSPRETHQAEQKAITFSWCRRRCFDYHITRALLANSESSHVESAYVEMASVEKTQKRPPPGLTTVDLLKLGSKLLRLSPQQTMRSAERLYLAGYISYPRTESSRYPESLDVAATLRTLASDSRWTTLVSHLLEDGGNAVQQRARTNGGIDAGDHPPIVPTSAYQEHGPEGHVFDMIVRRFLASVSPAAQYETASAQLRHLATNERFVASATLLREAGFLAAFRSLSVSSEKESCNDKNCDDEESIRFAALAELKIGTRAPLRLGRTPVPHKTEPPSLISEFELVEAMERAGIGTDASMAGHIHTIIKRGYATVDRTTRKICATPIGIALYRGLGRVDTQLVKPELRAHIEYLCDLVARGEARREHILRHGVHTFLTKFDYLIANAERIETLFEALFDSKDPSEETAPAIIDIPRFCRDGRSGAYLGLIARRRPARLFNAHTSEVFALPQGGQYRASNGVTCPRCNSEAIWFCLADQDSEKSRVVSYPLCARCFDEHSKTVASLEDSPLSDDHPLVMKYSLDHASKLIPQARGRLLLEPVVHDKGPPKLISTRLPVYVASFAAIVSTVRKLGSNQLELTFSGGQSPLEDGATVCRRGLDDPLLRSLLIIRKLRLGPLSQPKHAGNDRGRRRGGGKKNPSRKVDSTNGSERRQDGRGGRGRRR